MECLPNTYRCEYKTHYQTKKHDDIDEAVNCITCLIQEAAWRSTPPKNPGKNPISLTPPHIREIVTEKRRQETDGKEAAIL